MPMVPTPWGRREEGAWWGQWRQGSVSEGVTAAGGSLFSGHPERPPGALGNPRQPGLLPAPALGPFPGAWALRAVSSPRLRGPFATGCVLHLSGRLLPRPPPGPGPSPAKPAPSPLAPAVLVTGQGAFLGTARGAGQTAEGRVGKAPGAQALGSLRARSSHGARSSRGARLWGTKSCSLHRVTSTALGSHPTSSHQGCLAFHVLVTGMRILS